MMCLYEFDLNIWKQFLHNFEHYKKTLKLEISEYLNLSFSWVYNLFFGNINSCAINSN